MQFDERLRRGIRVDAVIRRRGRLSQNPDSTLDLARHLPLRILRPLFNLVNQSMDFEFGLQWPAGLQDYPNNTARIEILPKSNPSYGYDTASFSSALPMQ